MVSLFCSHSTVQSTFTSCWYIKAKKLSTGPLNVVLHAISFTVTKMWSEWMKFTGGDFNNCISTVAKSTGCCFETFFVQFFTVYYCGASLCSRSPATATWLVVKNMKQKKVKAPFTQIWARLSPRWARLPACVICETTMVLTPTPSFLEPSAQGLNF